MPQRRDPTQREVKANEGQAPQISNDLLAKLLTNVKIITSIQILAKVMMPQMNKGGIAPPNMRTTTMRVRDFKKMNPLEFHRSKVDEGPQEFVDKTYMVVDIMGVSLKEKVEFTAYQVMGIA